MRLPGIVAASIQRLTTVKPNRKRTPAGVRQPVKIIVADHLTRSQYSIHALDWIFERPIFKSSDFVASAGIPEPTAKRILPALREAGVLRVLMEASGRRAATLCFPALLNIAEGREAF